MCTVSYVLAHGLARAVMARTVCIQTNHEAAKVAYSENIAFHAQNEVADLLPLEKKKKRKKRRYLAFEFTTGDMQFMLFGNISWFIFYITYILYYGCIPLK